MDQQNQVPMGTLEPVGEGVVTGVPIVAVSPRSRRMRWAIASVVVVAVLVATVAGAFALSGAAGAKSLTAGAAPKGTVAFLEVRTDLPGDQHAKLADFMNHFPGFEDRTLFDKGLDEMLNKLTTTVSKDLEYTSAFKPWMEGEFSIAVTNLPKVDASTYRNMMGSLGDAFATPPIGGSAPAASTDAPASLIPQPGVVAIFALKDRAAADSWATAEIARTGLKVTTVSYNGTDIKVTGSGAGATAYALTDKDLLLGTLDGVKASLDTATGGSLNDNAAYQAAMKALSGDSLARFYVAPQSVVSYYVDTYNGMMGAFSMPSMSAFPTIAMPMTEIPVWVSGSIRAESDRMVVDVAYPRVKDDGIGNHSSRLAGALPGSTVAAFEIHSLGTTLSDRLKSMSSGNAMIPAAQLKQVTDMLSKFGGIDWIGDGVAAVTSNGSTFGGGVLVEATDNATAKAKAGSIVNLAALAGGAMGITTTDESYKGTDITIIKIPGSAVPVAAGTTATTAAPSGQTIEVAVAVKDNLIVAGYTDAFVKAVIDTNSSNSLASSSDYTAVTGAAGSSNEESVYVNIPALEDQIGRTFISADKTRWTQDYKPYFDHVGGIGLAVIDGNTVILRLVVMAK